ncbi:2'-5' RNA ligase family protein [Aridibaculum aurantiacum]|uniref:2'-5' RNA ligase family protein n=1 Tax=Aridibaculum aurantiacum TaxID=2810307 RepID=UPI001A975839|nr:2'-5' RNA ligase family protein [Aridibaculum aurantiacum]
MNNDLSNLPGYRLCDYILAIQPHEELWNTIIQVKKEFAATYEAPSAECGKPQVTLLRFSQLQMMEDRIISRLKSIAMALPAFKIELKDFGSQPSHTIYLNVESKIPLQMAIKHLKTAQSLLKTKEQKPHFMEDFYITIARQLLPWQYEKGWLEYSHKHFTGRFIANNMLLLRKAEGEKNFQTVESFEFLNMPVVTTQGQLF